jgi:hypothetical protein
MMVTDHTLHTGTCIIHCDRVDPPRPQGFAQIAARFSMRTTKSIFTPIHPPKIQTCQLSDLRIPPFDAPFDARHSPIPDHLPWGSARRPCRRPKSPPSSRGRNISTSRTVRAIRIPPCGIPRPAKALVAARTTPSVMPRTLWHWFRDCRISSIRPTRGWPPS